MSDDKSIIYSNISLGNCKRWHFAGVIGAICLRVYKKEKNKKEGKKKEENIFVRLRL
jgi:hypothetical protein